MEITRQRFIDAIKKEPFYVRGCSMCGYEMSYCFRGNQLGFDSGCDCVNYKNWQPVNDSDVDSYLEPLHGYLGKIKDFLERTEKL